MKLLEAVYIRQTCDVLAGLVELEQSYLEVYIERIFIFAVMWSLGAVLELDDRDKFEEFVLNHASKRKWSQSETNESIFDFVVNANGEWDHWSSLIEEYIYPSDKVS